MKAEKFLLPLAPGQEVGPQFEPLLSYAQSISAPVLLLSVVEQLKMLSTTQSTMLELLQRAIEEQRKVLTRQVEQLRKDYPELDLGHEVITGKAFVEIVKFAHREDCTLIGIDAAREHKRTACQYGSTARHLMRKSNIPVWVIAAKAEPLLKHVVAAVDIVSGDAETQRLNGQILERAHRFARQHNARLSLCHAWQFDSEGYLRSWARYDDIQIAEAAALEAKQRQLHLEALVHKMSLDPAKIDLVLEEGDPRSVICHCAESADLLVMGTLSRSGIAGFVMGNTAEEVLDQIHCSVLTLKPDGFESPVLGK